MATTPFRVVEKEYGSNFTTRVKAINYDSRYYANDKNSPAEDTINTDWAPGGDPTKFTSTCETDFVLYKMLIRYQGVDWASTEAFQDVTATRTVGPNPTQDSLVSTDNYSMLVMAGFKVAPTTLPVTVLQSYATAGSGQLCINRNTLGCLYIASTGLANLPMTGDTIVSNPAGAYPGYHNPMKQSGSWTWTMPGNWVKGLDWCYIASNSSSENAGQTWVCKPMLQRARVPNESSYYWVLLAKNNWYWGNQSGLSAQFIPAIAIINPV